MTRERTSGDVVERLGVGVQPRVQESEWGLARGEELVVDERNDGREDGRRARRAADKAGGAVYNDLDTLALRGDVGVRATGAVEEASVGGTELREVRSNRAGF